MIAAVQLEAVLNSLVGNRVYADVATEHDDSTLPYITYTDVSTVPENTLDGYTGHEWVRMQIDVWHDDKYQGILLANKVINAINSNIHPSIYGGKTGMYDADSKLYRQLIEYEFWQTTPTA